MSTTESIQDQIDDVEQERREARDLARAAEMRLAMAEAKLDVLRRELPSSAAATHCAADLTSSVIEIVSSAAGPMTAKEVIAELRQLGVSFTAGSVSALLGRHSCGPSEIDEIRPLRKVARGRYAANAGSVPSETR